MKILFVGEYSRLHNSLKEGLEKLGHNVTILSSGDGMKKYNTDIYLNSTIKSSYLLNKINNIFIRLFKIDIIKIEYAFKFKKILPQLKGYDIIQLINEDALFVAPNTQIKLLQKLIKQNKKIFVLCCGDDYTTVNYYLNTPLKYSILTPYLNDNTLKRKFVFSLKYITKPYIRLHKFLKQQSAGVIATDLDYHTPMLKENNYLGLIPNPINIDAINYIQPIINDKIYIFHGINSHSKLKKGSSYFLEALERIAIKYKDLVIIKITEDVPYATYINSYNDAHIILDQCYSYDQGYNALEAMAKGKVVFTGAEQIWLEYFKLEEDSVAINALPDANYLFNKLEMLILNPKRITEISKNARAFIKQHHDYKKIATRYIETWTNN